MDFFHLVLEKVGFSLGGRALSSTLRGLGCSAGLALLTLLIKGGFALRVLLTGQDWAAHMMLPSGEGTSGASSSPEASVQPPAPAPEKPSPHPADPAIPEVEVAGIPESQAPRGDPFEINPLISDEHRREELNDRLGINSVARPLDLAVRESIVGNQVLIEKKIEKALLSDGYSPDQILGERHKIRGLLFYPHGTPLSGKTYRNYLDAMENCGTHRSLP